MTTTFSPAWDAELIALRDEIYAEYQSPQFSICDAAQCAIAHLGELEAYAAAWDAQAAPYQPAPTPPTTPAARKAAYRLAHGVVPVAIRGGYLVPSGTRSTVVHFVTDAGQCSCEAGQHGRDCWHVAAIQQCLAAA